MTKDKLDFIHEDVESLKEQGLFIHIRTIESPADADRGRQAGAQLLH